MPSDRRFRAVVTLVALSSACHAPEAAQSSSLPAAAPRSTVTTPAPTPIAPTPIAPTQLGALRTNRLRVAHASLAPALESWKLAALGTDCTLMFNDQDEWLAGCNMGGHAPIGFAATGETTMGQPVLWNPHPLTMGKVTTPYDRVKLSVVGTVASQTSDADQTQTPVLVLQEWDALHKNHPGFQDSGIEEWLGIAVHEAFHAHQMWHPRVRAMIEKWKTTKPATADELGAYLKSDEKYRAAVDLEIHDLRLATDTVHDAKGARAALAHWVIQRRARRAAFEAKLEAALPGKNAWEMDAFYTFLEGTARYVEARFLMEPSPEAVKSLTDEATFKGFAATAGKKASELPGLSKGGTKYVYALGMYLSFLLDAAESDWKERIFATDGLLVAEVERVASPLIGHP